MLEATEDEIIEEFLNNMDRAVNDPRSNGYATIIVVDGQMIFLPGIQADFPEG